MYRSLTRREMLELLGAAASLGLASAAPQGSSRPIIRTLLKDVEPTAIAGPTLFHEHLSIRYPLTRALAAAPVPMDAALKQLDEGRRP